MNTVRTVLNGSWNGTHQSGARAIFRGMLDSPSYFEDDGMTNSTLFDEISERLTKLAASDPAAEVEKNIKALLASSFSRLDLVTRDEFEVQRELLARALERVTALEARLADSEKR